jgi:DNA-binding CsgD family transcriptional regulator
MPKRGTAKQLFEARQMYFKMGMSTQEIGERLGFSRKTIRRWISPRSADLDRKRSRQYYRRNRASLLEHKQLYERQNRRSCPLCGELMGIGSRETKRCQTCLDGEREFKWKYFEFLWNGRVPVEEIARQMEWTVNTVYAHVRRARKRGYQLDRRNLSATLRSERTRKNAGAGQR